jgi:hypothetical protein
VRGRIDPYLSSSPEICRRRSSSWRGARTDKVGRARLTRHRRKATRRRRAQPWASTHAGEELHGGTTSIPDSGCLARPPLYPHQAQRRKEGKGKRRKDEGEGELPRGRAPVEPLSPLPAATPLSQALRSRGRREAQGENGLGFGGKLTAVGFCRREIEGRPPDRIRRLAAAGPNEAQAGSHFPGPGPGCGLGAGTATCAARPWPTSRSLPLGRGEAKRALLGCSAGAHAKQA